MSSISPVNAGHASSLCREAAGWVFRVRACQEPTPAPYRLGSGQACDKLIDHPSREGMVREGALRFVSGVSW